MDAVNSGSEPDYSTWVTPGTPKPQPRRWCPTHRRLESCEPGERLRCGPAWRELYEMEREVEMERMSSNTAIIKLGESISALAQEIRDGERVIAEPPSKPTPPPPTDPRPLPRRSSGKGGVALP